jgi:ketosteroid isomerase-like protein
MRDVAERYFRCLDTEDWSAMAELWTPEAQLRAVGARPRNDRDGIIEYFSKLFDPWPTHRDHPDRLIVSEADQTVIAEVTFTGTTADGREVRFAAVDVFDFADGRIRKLTNWYDIDYARRMIGSGGPPEVGVDRGAASGENQNR